MKPWSCTQVVAACVLFSTVVVARGKCWPFDHPKVNCDSKGVITYCPETWPHATGNYGNSSYAKAKTCTPLGPILPTAYNQCCMPTLECHQLYKTAPRDKKGRFVHVEDFYKFTCCYEEFLRPKAWCMHPPGFDLDKVTWNLPPACSVWKGSSQHNALVFYSTGPN